MAQGYNYISSEAGNVIVAGNKITISGKEIPLPPKYNTKRGNNVTIINSKLYINGYEWKADIQQWKKTFKALYHKWF